MSLIAALALASGLAATPAPAHYSLIADRAAIVTTRQRVVVLGWRIIDNAFRTRREAYAAGMQAVQARNECADEDCGFLLMYEDNRWFLTNVAPMTFDDLMELRRDVSGADTMVVFRQAPAPETPRFVSRSAPPGSIEILP
jgi:hypothetical protein